MVYARLVFGGVSLWLAFVGVAAAAEPSSVLRSLREIITLPADDPCLAQGIDESVAAHLGRSEVDAELSIKVTTSGDTVSFQMRRGGEVRAEKNDWPLPSRCADRRAALGLAVAIAIDAAVLESLAPEVVPTSLEPKPEPKPERPQPEPPTPTPTVEPPERPEPANLEPEPPLSPEPARAETPAFRLAATLGPELLLGALPRAGFGGELGLEFGWISWLDIRVDGGGAAALRTSFIDGEVDAAMGWGALGLCPARSLGRVRVRLCAGVSAGAIVARGRGFDRSSRVTLPWLAVRTGADLDVQLTSRVALRVGGDLLTPLVRGTLSVRDETDALLERREPAPAGAQLGVAIVVRLAGPKWGE